MRLLLCGQTYGMLGIPNHTRSLFRNLIANRGNIEIKVLPTHPVPQDESHATYDLTSDIKDCIITPAQARDWSPTHVFIFWTPEIYKQIRSYFSGQNCKFINYLIFEWTIFTKEFTEEVNQMDCCSVPSEWAKQVCLNNGVKIPINILHAGIEEPYISSKGHNFTEDIDSDYKRFLFVGKMENRKSFDECLINFKEVHDNYTRKSFLKLLTFNQFGPQMDIIERLKQLKCLDTNSGEACAVPYLSKPKSPKHMRDYVYETSDFLLLPSKAGAIELPLLEALACGLPTIVTNYSGMAEYLPPDYYWKIPVKEMDGIYDKVYFPNKGQTGQWAIPDWEAFKQLIKDANDISLGPYKDMSYKYSKWVKEEFNYTKIAKEYLEFLGTI